MHSSQRVTWVGVDGAQRAGPRIPGVRTLSYDPRDRRLLATTPEDVVTIELGAAEIADVRSVRGDTRVWPLADGWLIAGEDGSWTHDRDTRESTTRILPRALSMWERDGRIEWLGRDHPRATGPVIIATDASNPLAAPALVEWPWVGVELSDTGGIRAAPHAETGFAWAETSGEGIMLYTEATALRVAEQPSSLTELLWLSGDVYLAAFEQPDSLLVVDLGAREVSPLDGLQGPLAGPLPCPAALVPP